MISAYYRDQLPDAVLTDPLSNPENLYLLASIMLYKQIYAPQSTEQIQLFILKCRDLLKWRPEDFARTLSEVGELIGGHELELDAVVFLIPTQKAAVA